MLQTKAATGQTKCLTKAAENVQIGNHLLIKKKSTYKYLNKIYKTHKNYKIHTEVKKCQGRLVGKNWKTATVYD